MNSRGSVADCKCILCKSTMSLFCFCTAYKLHTDCMRTAKRVCMKHALCSMFIQGLYKKKNTHYYRVWVQYSPVSAKNDYRELHKANIHERTSVAKTLITDTNTTVQKANCGRTNCGWLFSLQEFCLLLRSFVSFSFFYFYSSSLINQP